MSLVQINWLEVASEFQTCKLITSLLSFELLQTELRKQAASQDIISQ